MALASLSGIRNMRSQHVVQAIRRIDRKGIPPRHQSREWVLKIDDRKYPPKYVVKLAYEFSNEGSTISSEDFNVWEAAAFLLGLGFEVERI